MVRSVNGRSVVLAAAFALMSATITLAAQPQSQDSQEKHLDIQTNAGDLHLGTDADARKAGLPLYPGARPDHDKDNDSGVNVGLLTEAFGVKLVVAKYESDDAPTKIIDFYRDRLKKYGKVLECHRHGHAGEHADFNDDDDKKSQELKCEGDNTGPVTELKVGTENNQHVVVVEPNQGHSGASFAIVYVHSGASRATSEAVRFVTKVKVGTLPLRLLVRYLQSSPASWPDGSFLLQV